MKAIGGYFSLELEEPKFDNWFTDAVKLNSSRHALEYIIKSLPYQPRTIYIPYYTCEVVLEPIKRLGLNYQFYHIDEQLEIYPLLRLADYEIIIVNNYFGIKDDYINRLLNYYGDKVIVDDAQAFYHKVNKQNRAIYSPRKFFGVPDGGYAVTPDTSNIELLQDFSTDRSLHLLRRLDADAEAGYKEFHIDDASLSVEPMKAMSSLTKCLLDAIDYDNKKLKRRENFKILHSSLSTTNKLCIPNIDSFECPMVYPYMTNIPSLRQRLICNRIFVATYWPNVFEWCQKDTTEYKLAKYLLPLPIDQRYGKEDMKRVVEIIKGIG